MLQMMTTICSKPLDTARLCHSEERLLPLVKASLVLVLSGTAAFGLVLGSTRDAAQALASAVKLPLVWVLTLAICAPAFYALAAVLGQPLRMKGLMALALSAMARASLVLFALLPVLWLFTDVAADSPRLYHQVTLLAALMYGGASLAGLGVLLRGFDKRASSLPLLALFALTFLLVAGQTAWSLRPFVGRPAQHDLPLLRKPEGTFFEALNLGLDSARGQYTREAAASQSGHNQE